MNLYRIQLRPLGPFMTPWQSDTLSGSLCWQLLRTEGPQALRQLLERCLAGDPPFVLSDAFCGDLLPAPLHIYRMLPAGVGGSQEEEEAHYQLVKAWKDIRWLPLQAFEAVRDGRLTDLPATVHPYRTVTRLHASISRTSNRTLEPGGLREEEEHWLAEGFETLSVYALVVPDWAKRLEELWRGLAAGGFGKKKSVGSGAFEFVGMESFSGFSAVAGANGFVSLSHFVPAGGDPTEGDYEILVKHGKLGEEFALCENPFKRPLLMIRPGACFRAVGPIRQWYGRAVAGLAPSQPQVVQLAFALALPVRFPGG